MARHSTRIGVSEVSSGEQVIEAGAPRSQRRKRQVVDAARRVIVERGLEAASLRRITREAGFTTGVVSHYFPDKQAVIVGCFRAASDDWMSEVESALAAAASVEERVAVLVRLALPASDERRAEWRLWSEMWTYAGRDPAFARTLVETDARWERLIAQVLAEAQKTRLLDANLDVASEAAILARLIDGLGLRAWLSGGWADARRHLLYHLGTLGLPESSLRRLLAREEKTDGR